MFVVPGDLALQRFPEKRDRIHAVMQNSGAFTLEDLMWVAPCSNTDVRVSMGKPTHDVLTKHYSHSLPDEIWFQSGNADCGVAHLLFSFEHAVAEPGRMFGHFDVLTPSSGTGMRSMYFADPVAGSIN